MANTKTKEIVATETNTGLSTNVSGIEIDAEDIEIPRINLIQKMSQSDAPVGSILFDKMYEIGPPEVPVKTIVVAAQKGYRENIPFDEEEIPRIAWSKKEAESIAEESEWAMTEFAEITLLMRAPDDEEDDAFQLPIGDHSYALGKINVGKNAYRSTYKRLATYAAFQSATPIYSKIWNFTSEELTKGKYTWFNPSLTVTKEETNEDVLAFIKNFLGA
tara:strand:- start:718 stop:1371 length:654 start_codon:yes stop_codon:yes gene_type:complete